MAIPLDLVSLSSGVACYGLVDNLCCVRLSRTSCAFELDSSSVGSYLYHRYDGIVRWRPYKRDLHRACSCLAAQLFLVHAPAPRPSTTMKPIVPDPAADKKGHICPPSNAKHPSDRWESLFVYGFICRFTQLRAKVEGFYSPMEYVWLHPCDREQRSANHCVAHTAASRMRCCRQSQTSS